MGDTTLNLTEIANRNQTDKSSHHFYTTLYELLFRNYKALDDVRILEVGIQFGNSLRTWKDYFPFPLITGIDSVDNGVSIDRVNILIADAYKESTLLLLNGREFDLCIDDGSHDPTHQLFFVQNYQKLLSENGLLIVEDVPTKDCALMLKNNRPEGFNYTIVDMTEGNSMVDSRLFIMWRQ